MDGLFIIVMFLALSSVLLYWLISWVFRIELRRAALLVSIGIVLLCITWYATNIVLYESKSTVIYAVYLALSCVIILIFILFDRIRHEGTVLLNVISSVLVIQTIMIYLSTNEVSGNDSVEYISKTVKQSYFTNDLVRGNDLKTPNIFHIVLDGYSRNDVLKSVYRFDNQLFLDKLEEKGFTVYENARAPYNQTLFSMASVFSGGLLDTKQLAMQYNNATKLRKSLGRYLIDSPVSQWLKSLDYQVGLASEIGYSFIHARQEDKYYLEVTGKIEYVRYLYNMTFPGMLDKRYFSNTLSNYLIPKMTESPYAYPLNILLHKSLTQPLESWPNTPFLLYQHVISPHPPFIIDRYGQETDRLQPAKEDGSIKLSMVDGSHLHNMDMATQKSYIEGYVEKLIITNKLLDLWLDKLIENLPEPYVIIVQSDHGGGALFDQNSMENSCIQERFGILLAIHSSDPALNNLLSGSGLKSSPNSVNIYRALFNGMTGTKKEMAANDSRFISWNNPFKQIEVPEKRHNTECHLD
jgi:hypothetical protein